MEAPTMIAQRALSNNLRIAASLLAAVCLLAAASAATPPNPVLELEGFTEPCRTSHVAADDAGVIAELLVREGQRIEASQPIARLNCDIYRTLLDLAEHQAGCKGRLAAARAEHVMRTDRLAKIDALRTEGHARDEEVGRARLELTVAESNLLSAQEEQIGRQLECAKIKMQIDRRTIRAPFTGVVTEIHKEQGEFVALNDPAILTLVDLDSLVANFMVLTHQAAKLRIGEQTPVQFRATGHTARGIVEYIAPVTDAESGTVQIKVRIANPNRDLRSGERCTIRVSQ